MKRSSARCQTTSRSWGMDTFSPAVLWCQWPLGEQRSHAPALPPSYAPTLLLQRPNLLVSEQEIDAHHRQAYAVDHQYGGGGADAGEIAAHEAAERHAAAE